MRGHQYQPVATLQGICAIGDSNTQMSYMGLPGQCQGCNGAADNYSSRWTQMLIAATGWRVINTGQNGRKTEDFLGRGAGVFAWDNANLPRAWLNARAKYYLCCFGLNETTGGTGKFEQDTRELLQVIQGAGSIPILMTNVAVYFIPDLGASWYNTDRNIVIDLYDNVYRALASELGTRLIDVNAAFKAEIAIGNYDHRIRADGDLNADDDPLHVGDPEFANYRTNIHYRDTGAQIVSDTIESYITDNGLTEFPD